MKRLTLACLLAMVTPAAFAAEATPVCSQPTVLQEVATLLRQAGRNVVLEAGPVGQDSVGPDRQVYCAARGRMTGYDSNRYGMQPINEVFVVRYALELRQNGIFLHLLP